MWPKGELAEILLLVKDETQTKGGIKYHTHLPSHKHNMGLAKMGSPFARIKYNEHHQLPSSQHNMATMGYLFANPKSSLGILKRTTMQQGSIFRSRSEFYILHQWKISHVQDAPFCGLPSQDLQVEEDMFKVLTDLKSYLDLQAWLPANKSSMVSMGINLKKFEFDPAKPQSDALIQITCYWYLCWAWHPSIGMHCFWIHVELM